VTNGSPLVPPADGGSDAEPGQLAPRDLTVVVPAFNEAAHIGEFLKTLLPHAKRSGWRVIVVDDGSSDATGAILAQYEQLHTAALRVLAHPRNLGYGAALKSGIRQADTRFVATMDSDGQHTPIEMDKLLTLRNSHSLVVGQRTAVLHSPLWRMPGKWFLGLIARLSIGQRIPDLNSGLRVFRTDHVRRYLHLFPNGFSFSTTSTMLMLHRGYPVAHVPIRVAPRHGSSTVSPRTGFETLLLILRLVMLLSPLRLFLPLGALSAGLGIAWGIPYYFAEKGLTVTSLLLILNGILVILFGLLADQIAELRKERFEQ